MNHINFPESNMPLGAGDGNENTQPMRVMVCDHPEYKTKPTFYAGKFEFDDNEKEWLRNQILLKLQELPKEELVQMTDIADAIMSVMPNLWITSMNGWCPLVLSIATPQDMGYVKRQLNRPIDN